ncbi:MAG TPA: O-methyltransferase [Gemmatimonadales bacterium]|nr:O-methyltransferase [Gemmatimonadales bacterium]
MTEPRWTAVDRYAEAVLHHGDGALQDALRASDAAGLPSIAVSATQGKFLSILAMAMGAQRILEIGTLGGYSTIWLARGLQPGGRVVTLELRGTHASVAATNIARAGLADRVEIVVGPAAASLRALAARGVPPFDLVFIDADKTGYPEYLALTLELSRPGTMIIADNIVRGGAVIDADSQDADVRAVRRYNELLAADPRITATVLQTVGPKGYDGFAIAVVGGDPDHGSTAGRPRGGEPA